MESVWFDFGNGLQQHDEETPEMMDAFLAGVYFAMTNCDIDDYCQFDTLEEWHSKSQACPD